jgi:MoxR-like ATPase
MSDVELTPSTTIPLSTRLRAIRDGLLSGLVERDVAIRLALLAAVAGEHLLLIGPPGTAKSLVARRLQLAFRDASYFERLLTRFTVPEELFGPLSIKGLEEDRYERLTEAYLPTASVAFLDEIFKANSAILNALLTLLNEREFDNGAKRVRTPLVAVIGASNELPQGEELEAMYDRFLLRLHVGPVSKEGFRELLSLRGNPEPSLTAIVKLELGELEEWRRRADDVAVPDDILALLAELRDWCEVEGIHVSDRRWRKVVKMLQVSALTNDRSRVSIWDCWLLQHCLWTTPESRDHLFQWYAARVGATEFLSPAHLTRLVTVLEGRFRSDREARSQQQDRSGRPIFTDSHGHHGVNTNAGMLAVRDSEPVFLAPPRSGHAEGHAFRVVHDRTNGGRGYTPSELTALCVQITDRVIHPFEVWEDRDAYTSDQRNRLALKSSEVVPLMEPTRHKAAYIEALLGEVNNLQGKVDGYRDQLAAHVAGLETEIRSHLWVTPDFAEPAARHLATTLGAVDILAARIEQLKSGFGSLPVDVGVLAALDGEEEEDLESDFDA